MALLEGSCQDAHSFQIEQRTGSGSLEPQGTSESQHGSWMVPGSQQRPRTPSQVKEVWSYKATIAFWSSMYFVIGSVLFVVGSVSMIPGFCPPAATNEEAHEEYFRVWVDYSFMVGAWCFTLGNYLAYFQVINKLSTHGAGENGGDPGDHGAVLSRLRCFACPSSDLGELAAFANVIGALFYNVNTMGMFGGSEKFGMGFNIGYVATGTGGSFFFALGALLEGEYNDWRNLRNPEVRANWAVWMSWFGFIGAILFFYRLRF